MKTVQEELAKAPPEAFERHVPKTFWTDEEVLEVMHLLENEGLTRKEVATRIGRSRNAVCGLAHRVNTETDAFDETPELNGTLPPRWWKR